MDFPEASSGDPGEVLTPRDNLARAAAKVSFDQRRRMSEGICLDFYGSKIDSRRIQSGRLWSAKMAGEGRGHPVETKVYPKIGSAQSF